MAASNRACALVHRASCRFSSTQAQQAPLRQTLGSRRTLQTTQPFVDSPPPTDAPISTSKSSNKAPQHEKAASKKTAQSGSEAKSSSSVIFPGRTVSSVYNLDRAPSRGRPLFGASEGKIQLTESIKTNLPHLLAQPPFYARIYIHAKSYLVTAGDELRLPFLMHGVMPGDILRLDRITHIGSREFTLVGGTAGSRGAYVDLPPREPIVGNTDGSNLPAASSKASAPGDPTYGLEKKGPRAFLDDRLFVCRATVLGTDTEPMRVEEKTKRRQRHVKHVKSKMRFTVLRITEIRPRPLEELDVPMPV